MRPIRKGDIVKFTEAGMVSGQTNHRLAVVIDIIGEHLYFEDTPRIHKTHEGHLFERVGPTTGFLSHVKDVFGEMEELLIKKNTDYATDDDPYSAFRNAGEYGVEPIVGLALRINDKIGRLKSFCKKGELSVESEPLEDIFKDLIGYSVMALGILREGEEAYKEDKKIRKDLKVSRSDLQNEVDLLRGTKDLLETEIGQLNSNIDSLQQATDTERYPIFIEVSKEIHHTPPPMEKIAPDE